MIQAKQARRVLAALPVGIMAMVSMLGARASFGGPSLGGDASCKADGAYFEYRSCYGSRTWCGFDTFIPSSPPTKYRTRTLQDTAGGYTITGSCPPTLFYGLKLSVGGTVTYSASGSGTNWTVFARYQTS